jgi:hypothetical protein
MGRKIKAEKSKRGCVPVSSHAPDHTLKETTSFLRSRSLDIEKIVPWLHEHGGYCDCEALGNIVDEFEKIISREKKST